ncbi:hypothetical protein [Archangium violaceum]|uniref:Uncharacterized protein n=1 Tax=Archangium violaceum Cb vi76 TaxID=1406225 RepID=A0A084ST11_9BACT|nr:hypothetical protein [Archangium violaceum]KFA91596.1 hypothetical protein Q664_20935 [Archangium violaceum Cb vi76]
MSIWQKLSSRFRGHSDEVASRPDSESPGMTYADFERDKDLKERQLSGAFESPPFGKDASAIEQDE